MSRVAVALIITTVLAGVAFAGSDGKPQRIYGPARDVGSSAIGPYLVDARPAKDGGAMVALLTRYNMSDAPPGDLLARRLDADGVPVGEEMVTWADQAVNVQSADFALGRDGGGLAVWETEDLDASTPELFVRAFDPADARPTDEATRISTNGELDAVAALGDGYVVLYSPLGGLEHYALRLDASGAPVAEPQKVTGAPLVTDVIESADASVATMITYRRDRQTARRIAADGTLGEPTPIDEYGYGFTPGPEGSVAFLTSRAKRVVLRLLRPDGGFGTVRIPRAAGKGPLLAYAGDRGLLAWSYGRKGCDGVLGVFLRAGARSQPKPVQLVEDMGCARKSRLRDMHLTATGNGRFALAWTVTGPKTESVFAQGVSR